MLFPGFFNFTVGILILKVINPKLKFLLGKILPTLQNVILILNFRWKQENRLHQCQQIIQHLLLHGIHRNFYLPTHVMTRINITKSEMPVLSNYLVLLKNKKTTATFKKFLFYSQDINSRISSRLRSLGPLSKCKRSSSNSSIVNGSSPELFC